MKTFEQLKIFADKMDAVAEYIEKSPPMPPKIYIVYSKDQTLAFAVGNLEEAFHCVELIRNSRKK